MIKTKTRPKKKAARKKAARESRREAPPTAEVMADPKPPTVLILRTCGVDGTSSYDFRWPETGPVECSDWRPTKACGNGLHGWLWGAGDWSLKKGGDITWKVVEVLESKI